MPLATSIGGATGRILPITSPPDAHAPRAPPTHASYPNSQLPPRPPPHSRPYTVVWFPGFHFLLNHLLFSPSAPPPPAALQAELLTRKGSTISENSSLAIFRVLSDSATFTIAPACVDADSTCDAWHQSGECTRNRDFMARECARSCGLCAAGAATPKSQPTADCFDANADCPGWVVAGECEANLGFMRENCRLSCRICPGLAAVGDAVESATGGGAPLCADETRDCAIWMKAGECHSNRDFMLESCRRSCGFCDGAAGGAEGSAQAVMAGAVCVDTKAECATWAAGGQCAKNGDWMRLHCKRACGLCEPPCEDLAEECPRWAVDGWCERNWGHMQKTCRSACGVCGGAAAPECHDMQAACEDWANNGECSVNAVFMNGECRRACGLCVAASGRRGGGASPPGPPAREGERIARQEGQRHAPAKVGAAQRDGGRARAGKACEDEIGNCAEIVQSSHTACKAPMTKSSCAKSCGACGDTQQTAKRRPRVEAQTQSRERTAEREQGGGRDAACIDRIPNCAAVVAKTPEACATAPLMKTSCEKSCGLCGGGRQAGKDEL